MKRTLVLAMACLLALTCVGFAEDVEEEPERYEYLYREFWDFFESPQGYWYNGVGNIEKGYNFEEFVNSEMGKTTIANLWPMHVYGVNDQDLYDYWRGKGMVRKVYNVDDPLNNWSVLVPSSAYIPGNEDRTYPLVFVLHGANNPIHMAETYGYCELGGEREFITVLPFSNNHDTIVEDIPTMMEELRANYPIDESRIYAVGYSLGGVASITLALNYPTMFAAVAPGGTSLGGFGWELGTDEQWAALKDKGMPFINLYGSLDFFAYYPQKPGDLPATYYQRWLDVNGVDFVAYDPEKDYAASEEYMERETGVDFMEITKKVYETDCHIGYYKNAEGVAVGAVACFDKMPHWPIGSFAEVAWDFLEHWSRDIETGESIYAE